MGVLVRDLFKRIFQRQRPGIVSAPTETPTAVAPIGKRRRGYGSKHRPSGVVGDAGGLGGFFVFARHFGTFSPMRPFAMVVKAGHGKARRIG